MAAMTDHPAYPRFVEIWGELADLEAAEQLLEWDQDTTMPAGGVEGRARVSGTLARVRHERLSSPELAALAEELAKEAPAGSIEAIQAAEAFRSIRQAERVPVALRAALAQTRSRAHAAWEDARKRSDFSLFEPQLAHLVALKREEATALADGGEPYDALLDLYERGATSAGLAPLFTELRRELGRIVHAVADSGAELDTSVLQGDFPVDAQRRLGLEIAEALGFDFACGRLDTSAHPFCITIHSGDVRLTCRWQEDDFLPALFGILHEVGHGLYEQGLPEAWRRTPLGAAVSLGIHESQSRLWENHVGRSRAFLRWLLPHLRQTFPVFVGTRVDRLWPLLHRVQPSLIRTEADETTYNLHVLIRFEIERALFSGDLRVAELPGAWDDLYAEVLGIRPGNAAEGVLQDVHWAMGSFGYFPTYTLGTLAAAQLFAAAERSLPGLEDDLAHGHFAPLLGWLREHVHQHASRYTPAELIERATGKPLSAADFLTYIKQVTHEVYGLRL
jgi:carboxypeptidase Taq